jgi:hypothetical protein
MMIPPGKIYLGDAVYAEIIGGDLVLTTEDGARVTNRIVFDGWTWMALVAYVQAFTRAHGEGIANEEAR